MRVDQDRQLGLAEHVNEARRDNHAVRVNGARGLRRAQKADGGNASVANADVARVPGRARAVNDVSIADDQVVRSGGLGVQGRERQKKDESEEGKAKGVWHKRSGEIVNGGGFLQRQLIKLREEVSPEARRRRGGSS